MVSESRSSPMGEPKNFSIFLTQLRSIKILDTQVFDEINVPQRYSVSEAVKSLSDLNLASLILQQVYEQN